MANTRRFLSKMSVLKEKKLVFVTFIQKINVNFYIYAMKFFLKNLEKKLEILYN